MDRLGSSDDTENSLNHRFKPRSPRGNSPFGILSEMQNRVDVIQQASNVDKGEKLGSSSPAYDLIKELDEQENWRERVVVLTRQDHDQYLKIARDILHEVVDNLPVQHSCELPAIQNTTCTEDSHLTSSLNASLDNSSVSEYESASEESKFENQNVPSTIEKIDEKSLSQIVDALELSNSDSILAKDSEAAPIYAPDITSNIASLVDDNDSTHPVNEETPLETPTAANMSQTNDNSDPVVTNSPTKIDIPAQGSYNSSELDYDSNPFTTNSKVANTPPGSPKHAPMEPDLLANTTARQNSVKLVNSSASYFEDETDPNLCPDFNSKTVNIELPNSPHKLPQPDVNASQVGKSSDVECSQNTKQVEKNYIPGKIDAEIVISPAEDELILSKGQYDFDSFNSVSNPFTTNTKVANTPPASPVCKTEDEPNVERIKTDSDNDLQDISDMLDNLNLEGASFATNSKVDNSTPVSPKILNDCNLEVSGSKLSPKKSIGLIEVDPRNARSNVPNLPPKEAPLPEYSRDLIVESKYLPKSTSSDYEMINEPIPKGKYNFDFDANPFLTNSSVTNSPPASPKVSECLVPDASSPKTSDESLKRDDDTVSPAKVEVACIGGYNLDNLDIDAIPFKSDAKVMNSPPVSDKKPDLIPNNTSEDFNGGLKTESVGKQEENFIISPKEVESPNFGLVQECLKPDPTTNQSDAVISSPKEATVPRGNYDLGVLDFGANPFVTTSKVMNSPSASPKKPNFIEVSNDVSSAENVMHVGDIIVDSPQKEIDLKIEKCTPSNEDVSSPTMEIIPKGSYNLGALGIDVDPFATNLKVVVSPATSPKKSNYNHNDTLKSLEDNRKPESVKENEGNVTDVVVPSPREGKLLNSDSTVEECLSSNRTNNQSDAIVSFPKEEIIPRGAYNLDALDCDVDPFVTKSKFTSSPPISPKIPNVTHNITFDDVEKEEGDVKIVEDSLPKEGPNSEDAICTSEEGIIPKGTYNLDALDCNVDPFVTKSNFANSPPISPKNHNVIHNMTFEDDEKKEENITSVGDSSSKEDAIFTPKKEIIPKGTYNNLDTLDCDDPFATKSNFTSSPPISQKKKTPTHNTTFEEGDVAGTDVSTSKKGSKSEDTISTSKEEIIPKGTYNLDALDCDVDPFATKSKFTNSPPVSPKTPNVIHNIKFEGNATKEGNITDVGDSSPKEDPKSKDAIPTSKEEIIPKGTYNLDALDYDVDPFATKSKFSSSPPISPKTCNFVHNTTFDDVEKKEGDVTVVEGPKSKDGISTPKEEIILKGTYNLDALDCDVDPFATKSKFTSSPPISQRNPDITHDVTFGEGDIAGAEDSLPKEGPKFEDDISTSKEEIIPNGGYNLDNLDLDATPFKTNSNASNSPLKSAENTSLDEYISSIQNNSGELFTNDDNGNSSLDVKDVNCNPLNDGGNLSFGPLNDTDGDVSNPFETKAKVSISPCRGFSDRDPFATKGTVSNSPSGNISSVDIKNDSIIIGEIDENISGCNESDTNVSNNTTVIENQNFVDMQLQVENQHDQVLHDANKADESSEDSGIQILVSKKKSPNNKVKSLEGNKPPVSHISHRRENGAFGLESVTSNDFSDVNRIQEFNDEALENQSEAGPDIADFTAEEFRSASEFFKDPSAFEFLQKAGSSEILADSTLARMSLYVKFDPLFKQDPSDRASSQFLPVNTASNRNLNSQLSAPSPNKLIDFSPSPKKRPPPIQEKEQLLVAIEKEPEIAEVAMTENCDKMPMSDFKSFTEEEMNQALKIQELLYQEKLLKKDKQWNEKLKNANREREKERVKVNSLEESQNQMTQIIAEFEKTISDLVTQKKVDKTSMQESIDQLNRERDTALDDLQSVETAFSDLHRRYEKLKTTMEGMKKNEETLSQTNEQNQAKLKKAEQKYNMLKSHAETALENANQEILHVKKSNEIDLITLQAQLKKSEMKVKSLERSVEEKIKEAVELSAICDELIQKVGHT